MKIDYQGTLKGVDPSRRKDVQKKCEKLLTKPIGYGIPLMSNQDHDLQHCYEMKCNEMRIIYRYSNGNVKILAIGERSKKKVYNAARAKLGRKKSRAQRRFEKILFL